MNAKEFLEESNILDGKIDTETDSYWNLSDLLEAYAEYKLNEQRTEDVQNDVLKPSKYAVELSDN